MSAPLFRIDRLRITAMLAVLVVLAVAPVLTRFEFAIAAWVVTISAIWCLRNGSDADAMSLAAFAACWLAGHTLVGLSTWPVPATLSFVAFGFVLGIRPYRGLLARVRVGRGDARSIAIAVTIAAGACVVLLLLDVRRDRMPGVASGNSLASFVAASVIFATMNAAIEEFVWRFAAWEAARRIVVPAVGVICLQAVSFGIAHYFGVPNGWSGVALATAFGAALGALRHVSGGLLLPWVVHAIADLTIYMRLA